MRHRLRTGLSAAVILSAASAPVIAADKLTDAQIAHIAYTAGDLDVKAAEVALKTSKNQGVIAFATAMVRDHNAVNEKALALVKKLNVTPEDNDVSKGLVKSAQGKQDELKKLTDTAFDKAYVDNEVAYHKTVNGALETTLIPSSANADLKALLQTGLKIFQAHQHHAEQLATQLR